MQNTDLKSMVVVIAVTVPFVAAVCGLLVGIFRNLGQEKEE